MAKVVTSDAGIQSTQVIVDPKRTKPGAAAPLEMKAGDGSPPIVDGPGERIESKQSNPDVAKSDASTKSPDERAAKEETDSLEPEDKDLPERARRRIGKYSVAAKQETALRKAAEAEAEESERFAKQLFDEREQYRKKVEELEARVPKEEAKKPEFIAPDENDPKYKNDKGEFEWKKFSTDNAAYEAKKAIAEDRESRAKEEQAREQAAKESEFKKRMESAQKKNPDWLETVTNSSVVLPNVVLQYIQESEYGTDIAYYLAKNQTDAERIKALPPIRAIAELGKIETGFEKPAESSSAQAAATSKTVERQGAPAPITPISTSGSGSINVDPAKMNYKELRAYERERARNRRR
jgi:hypothetical protein